jgi:ribosomal protein L17
MSTDLLKYLSDKIEEERKVIEADLAEGKAADFAQYKHATGVIRGLLIANNLVLEIAQRMENDDD